MHAWPLNKFMPGEGDTVGFGRLMKFAGDAVRERLQPGDETSEYDLIRGYLRNGVDAEDVVQECITLVYVKPLPLSSNRRQWTAG
jgi:hypothetical protein